MLNICSISRKPTKPGSGYLNKNVIAFSYFQTGFAKQNINLRKENQ